jgi:hypothetical protein
MALDVGNIAKKAGSAAKKKLGIGGESGTLTKLKIGNDFEVFLNPNQLSHSIKVNHAKSETATIEGKDKEGKQTVITPTVPVSTDPESLSFELMLDGTGVTGRETDVPSEIAKLAKAVFGPLNDSKKRKEEVTIKWGEIISFTGHVETFDTTYTLFKPDGTPLRATVKLSFLGNSTLTKAPEKERGKTKEIDIDAAKTIVNACNAIYNSPVAYIAVAKANKLTNVRKLKSGSKLVFPPKKG